MRFLCYLQILCGYNASWVKTKSDEIPPHVFTAGYATETDGEPLFIGRARIGGHLIPGKVHTHYKTCYIPYENREIEINSYEILVVPDKLPDAVVWRKRNMTVNSEEEEGEQPVNLNVRQINRNVRQRILCHGMPGRRQLL